MTKHRYFWAQKISFRSKMGNFDRQYSIFEILWLNFAFLIRKALFWPQIVLFIETKITIFWLFLTPRRSATSRFRTMWVWIFKSTWSKNVFWYPNTLSLESTKTNKKPFWTEKFNRNKTEQNTELFQWMVKMYNFSN